MIINPSEMGERCTFASHVPVLQFLLETLRPRTALEAGGGLASTPLLREHCEVVTTLEQDEAWFEVLKAMPGGKGKGVSIFPLSRSRYFALLSSAPVHDLAFVDGDLARWREIAALVPRIRVIVAHDTDADCYQWQRVEVPPGWTWVDITDKTPWTSVLTDRAEVVDLLRERFATRAFTGGTFRARTCPVANACYMNRSDWDLHDSPL